MPWQVFYSYSHKDEAFRNQLGNYLAPLRQSGKIVEWHDRRIEPGADWNVEIAARLESADLIIMLLSPDFLASEYCFGLEMERALDRLKRGAVTVAPVLLRSCLWEESRFSTLQIIPRDAKPILSSVSIDETLKDVAIEIRKIVSAAKPAQEAAASTNQSERTLDASLNLVRKQIHAYARMYERTRQRMKGSNDRTRQMEAVFQKMRALVNASYPLLQELASSPSPGDRLAAISILQVFSDEAFLPFLVNLVGSEKPFVGYHATRALHFAVGSLDTRAYPTLLSSLHLAQEALKTENIGFDSDRQSELRAAESELRASIDAISSSSQIFD